MTYVGTSTMLTPFTIVSFSQHSVASRVRQSVWQVILLVTSINFLSLPISADLVLIFSASACNHHEHLVSVIEVIFHGNSNEELVSIITTSLPVGNQQQKYKQQFPDGNYQIL